MPQRRGRQLSESPAEKKPTTHSFKAKGRWSGQEQIPVLWTDNIFIQLRTGQFLVSFGQAEFPYELEISDAAIQHFEKEGVPVVTIARIAASPEFVGQIISELTRVYEVWRQRQQQLSAQAVKEGKPL